MADEAGIRKHERQLARVIRQFESQLQTLITTAQDTVGALGITATREQVRNAYQPVRDLAQSTRQQLDTILASNLEINSDVLTPQTSQELIGAVEQLKTQTIDKIVTQIDAEQNSVIDAVVLAGIAGATATDLVSQTKRLMRAGAARINTQLATSVLQFDTVVTRIRATEQNVKRFRYVGGIVDKTRPFCASIDGGVFTVDEIQSMWREEWSGKAPGDPFVVRGGYNCRHFWIPVESDE